MYFLKHLYKTFLALATIIFIGCQDELLWDDGEIPEGVSSLSVKVDFKQFTPALDSRASGTATKQIKTLWMVVYNVDGSLNSDLSGEISDFSVLNTDNNSRPDGTESSESQTGHAEFSLNGVPNGRYRFYAVANLSLDGLDYSTEDKLRNITLSWQSDDASNNAEMFGLFTEDDSDEGVSLQAPLITVRSSMNIHTWLRRAASKVTIAFNTENLRENVYIYIKSVTIKDIPLHCPLATGNQPGKDNGSTDTDEILTDGEVLYFANADASTGPAASENESEANYNSWLALTKSTVVAGLRSSITPNPNPATSDGEITNEIRTALLDYEHDEAAPALYFYENLQGVGSEGTITDKRQDVNGDNKNVSYPKGNDPSNEAWKDGMPYGSYIEIQGYYISTDVSRPGKGPITYRFMLGKDEKTDYNAERNTHYKLTLNFNGFANDIDFHIDWDEENTPGLFTPTAYVSYMYNQESTAIVKATPKPGYVLKSLTAIILKNEWRPHEASTSDYNSVAWDMQMSGSGSYSGGSTAAKQYLDDEADPNGEFGWLSLRKTTAVNVDLGGSSSTYGTMVTNFRNYYYEPTGYEGSFANVTYSKIPTSDTDKYGTEYNIASSGDKEGTYTVIRTTSTASGYTNYVFQLPIFTREKTLDQWANYSGSNPFYGSYRLAQIKYIATYVSETDDSDTYEDTSKATIYQTQRIDNPRMVMRAGDNTSSFTVNLANTVLPVSSNTFNILNSSGGPWSATIELDPNNLIRLRRGSQVANSQGESVTGSTGSVIEFTIEPKSAISTDAAKGAVITVLYHNNSCSHKIIYRQGYGLTTIGGGSAKWSSFNVFDSSTLCESPLSRGALFRSYSSLSYPISEKNDVTWGVGVEPTSSTKFIITGQSNTKWTSIPNHTAPVQKPFGTFSLSNSTLSSKTYRVPAAKQFTSYISGNDDIDFAFGIAYADGASSISLNEDAVSYYDPDNKGLKNNKGVRGVVAYDRILGNNLFFSFGQTGHAHRKNLKWVLGSLNATSGYGYSTPYGYGVLRYGSLDIRLAGSDGMGGGGSNTDKANNYRPMSYDLPNQYGGIYWLCGTSTSYASNVAMDFNYGDYHTSALDKGNVFTKPTGSSTYNSDALVIRPVIN